MTVKAPYLIACNWKMYLNYKQAIDFVTKNTWSQFSKYNVVIFPSFESLSQAKELVKNSIGIGAQDCSAHESGAYTGQVSAQSLAEIGCNYCIIGHSETRKFLHVSNEEVVKKIQLLFKYNIVPLLCIGESQEEYQSKKTVQIIDTQLKDVMTLLNNNSKKELIIAYEPIWSIGTNIIPPLSHLQIIYEYLQKKFHAYPEIRFLYGGSVDAKNIQNIKQIPLISGFLIGRASTDFQELKNIVLSL